MGLPGGAEDLECMFISLLLTSQEQGASSYTSECSGHPGAALHIRFSCVKFRVRD